MDFCRNEHLWPVIFILAGQNEFCYITNTLWVITLNSYIWHTCKVFFSSVSFTFHIRINHSGFSSLLWSNIHRAWIRTIFWRCIIFWDTSIYVTRTIRKSICIKFTEKCIFAQNFAMHHFLKCYGNKPTFIIYTGWNKNLMEQNVIDNGDYKLYNEPLTNFKL